MTLKNPRNPQIFLSQFTAVAAKIGLLSFGGPAAQIALMQDELVDKRGWISQDDFLRTLSFCMLLPGPEAMQLATYLGWRLHGVRGGLIGGSLFILPGALVIFALALAYVGFGQTPLLLAAFMGIKACVVVIVVQALLKISKRALRFPMARAMAASSFCAISITDLPYPAVVLVAAIWGIMALPDAGHPVGEASKPPQPTTAITILLAALWAAPIALLWLIKDAFLTKVAVVFSTLAVVTFGGAYAVLGYLGQTAVTDLNWITAPQMVDALGLAETTPGPLILVTQFVGFLAGYQAGGFGLALLAGMLTLWVTFIPCFLWIFLCAPHLERLMSFAWLARGLAGITAAVVGVIASISIWFASQIWFSAHACLAIGPFDMSMPQWQTVDGFALGLSTIAAILLIGRKWDILVVLPVMALVSIAVSLL
jgi:chromate transporter